MQLLVFTCTEEPSHNLEERGSTSNQHGNRGAPHTDSAVRVGDRGWCANWYSRILTQVTCAGCQGSVGLTEVAKGRSGIKNFADWVVNKSLRAHGINTHRGICAIENIACMSQTMSMRITSCPQHATSSMGMSLGDGHIMRQ
ncbi:MAG: hypothetical protein HC767_08685 [Akkermansiaceae bacterium]|nr:hypothetical protein [Akkermansiaceae bacterium]